MTNAAFASKAFGLGAMVGGFPLVAVPDVVLRLVQMPLAENTWVRLWGMEIVVLGFYYVAAGRANLKPFFVASVQGRLGFSAVLLGLVALGSAPWQVLVIGAFDALGAVWTWRGLRDEPSVGGHGPSTACLHGGEAQTSLGRSTDPIHTRR
jgi:hypothetical protein